MIERPDLIDRPNGTTRRSGSGTSTRSARRSARGCCSHTSAEIAERAALFRFPRRRWATARPSRAPHLVEREGCSGPTPVAASPTRARRSARARRGGPMPAPGLASMPTARARTDARHVELSASPRRRDVAARRRPGRRPHRLVGRAVRDAVPRGAGRRRDQGRVVQRPDPIRFNVHRARAPRTSGSSRATSPSVEHRQAGDDPRPHRPRGRDALPAAGRTADVVVENFTPRVMEQLRLGVRRPARGAARHRDAAHARAGGWRARGATAPASPRRWSRRRAWPG